MTDTTKAQRQARWRNAQRKSGLIRKTIWLRPEDWPAVQRILNRTKKP